MNGRGWSAPQVVNLVVVSLVGLIGLGILHSNSRVMRRIDAVEDQLREVQRTVSSRPAAVPAPAAGGTEAARSSPGSPVPGFVSPTAPGPGDVRPVPPQGDWYIQGEVGEPETLNYYCTSGSTTSQVTSYCLSRLIGMDIDRPPKVLPALAWKWEVSEDKLRYTFHLRPDVQFSDGHPFTADDVMFTYAVIQDQKVNAHHVRSGLTEVEKVEKVDDFTIRVKYARPYWKGLYAFAFSLRVIPRHWYEREIPRFAKERGIEEWSVEPGKEGFAEVFNQMRDVPPGTGAYMYRPGVSWKLGETITVFRNSFSWYKREWPWRYNLDALQWRFVKDTVAQHEEFRKEALDVLVVQQDAWEDNLSKDPVFGRIANHFVYDHTGLAFGIITWNNRRPPFDDARVRRAMTMLTDRETILAKFYRGKGRIATCITKPTYPEYSLDIQPWPFDIEGAKKLLAEAGYADTNGDGVLEKDGKDFDFEFRYPSGFGMYRQIAALLRDACTKAGIRMRESPLEWSVFLEQFLEQKFEAVILGQSFSDPWHDPFEEWHSSQDVPRGNNQPGWRNREADAIMEAMRVEFDDGKRAELFHRFNRIFHEEQPVTLLVHPLVGVVLNKRFQDVTIRPTGLQMIDFWVRPEDQRYR